MDADFDKIREMLLSASLRPDVDPGEFLTFLARLSREVRQFERAAMLAKFGSAFKPAGQPVDDPAAERQFQPFQQVFTPEGYLGYVAGHDKQGRAIVNVVWEASEYDESKLTALPGPDILDSMRT